jgi:hypothetical protein
MKTRRFFLGAAAAGAGSIGSQASLLAALPPLTQADLPPNALQFASRAAMSERAGLPDGTAAVLGESGREGLFVLRRGKTRNDPRGGLHVRAKDLGVYWSRVWDGVTGRPEWFGARRNDPDAAAENRAALQACIDLCPTTLLGGGDYYVDGMLKITRNGTAIVGAAHTQTDQTANDAGGTSRILSTSSAATIITVGHEGAGRPRALTETVRLEGFTVDRAVAPFTPPSGMEGCIGIALRWCVNCHLERVFSINSARGFFYYGVVETYARFCGALRGRQGSNRANDCFIGFHFDYSAPSGYNGGNASVYLIYCRAFPLTEDATPSLTYSAGVRFDGGWVDCSIHGFESGAGIQYGIHGLGDGQASDSFRTENLIISNCLLDTSSVGCIWLEQAGIHSAVVIANSYLATSVGTCIVLSKIAGAVTISGCQYISGDFTGTGLSANEVRGLRSHGNIFTAIRQPVWLYAVSGFEVRDTIHGSRGKGDHPAVGASGCARGTVDCIVGGPTASYTAGVLFRDATSRGVEVRATAIDPAALADPGNVIVHQGAKVRVPGAFGAGCLATGVVG